MSRELSADQIRVASSEELSMFVAPLIFGPWDESRCRVCGWPLKEKIEEGCVSYSCSMYPRPERRADDTPDMTQPEMTVMLLDKIATAVNLARGGMQIGQEKGFWRVALFWFDENGEYTYRSREDEQFARAVLEAAALWLSGRAT